MNSYLGESKVADFDAWNPVAVEQGVLGLEILVANALQSFGVFSDVGKKVKFLFRL